MQNWLEKQLIAKLAGYFKWSPTRQPTALVLFNTRDHGDAIALMDNKKLGWTKAEQNKNSEWSQVGASGNRTQFNENKSKVLCFGKNFLHQQRNRKTILRYVEDMKKTLIFKD